MKRVLRRLIVALVVLIVGVTLTLFLTLNASLPQLDGVIVSQQRMFTC